MPDSVANLKRENNSLKAQVSTMADEISRLEEMIEQQIGNTVSPTSNDGVRSVELLSKEYDDLNCFRAMDSLLSAARIFDHLSPRMQTVLFEAKKFKEQHRYQYCWSKGSFVYLRKNTSSRAIKIKDLDDLGKLQTKGNS